MRAGPSNTFIAFKAISLADDLSGTEKRVAAAIIDHFNRKTAQCDLRPGTDTGSQRLLPIVYPFPLAVGSQSARL